jgi:hypothetical protein
MICPVIGNFSDSTVEPMIEAAAVMNQFVSQSPK